MREQIAQYPRRASATPEELEARRTSPANKHRTGHYAGLHPEDAPYLSDDIEEDASYYPQRMPSSTRRYTTTQEAPQVIRNGNKKYIVHNSPPPHVKIKRTPHPQEEEYTRPRHSVHWSLIFGIGMAAMLTLWIVGNMLVSWWNVTQDDLHYGKPRTFQIDAVVGHNNDSPSSPSHFIAINYRSHIQIIEFPAGDTTKAKIYQGLPLFGDGEDLAVVTLSFRDLNGDGKPDMIINVANTHIVYINENGQFRPLKPGEHVSQY